MRTLAIVEFVTLDGVMQGFDAPDADDPGFAHGGWGVPYQHPDMAAAGGEGQVTTSAYLLGRRTYQRLAAFWPTQPDDNPMAAHLNSRPKYVATRTDPPLTWNNSHVLAAPLPEAVRALKAEGEGSIVVLGSGELVQQLLAHGLVDQLTLFVHPLVLGSGKRLFREPGAPLPLRLDGVTSTATGVLVQRYSAQASASQT